MKNIIFTDGSSRGNPGPGGWGSVIIESVMSDGSASKVTELGGAEKHTTNNKMEIMSAIEGLSHVSSGSVNTVFTDSSYLINGITKWIFGWQKNGWKTKTKEDVSNKDLWIKLSEQVKNKTVEWKHIAGHAGIAGNERCDSIATAFADGKKVDLYNGVFAGYAVTRILNVSQEEGKLENKKSSSSHSKAKAYSYISAIGGKVEIHHSWLDCEKRVKGAKGARYKKSVSKDDEVRIIGEFSS